MNVFWARGHVELRIAGFLVTLQFRWRAAHSGGQSVAVATMSVELFEQGTRENTIGRCLLFACIAYRDSSEYALGHTTRLEALRVLKRTKHTHNPAWLPLSTPHALQALVFACTRLSFQASSARCRLRPCSVVTQTACISFDVKVDVDGSALHT